MSTYRAHGALNRDRICACTGVPTLFLQSSAAGGATRSGEGAPNHLQAPGVGAARLLLGILPGEDALRHLAPERDPQAPVRLRIGGRRDPGHGVVAAGRALARALIYVTHDQIEAMTMADRIVIMDMGDPDVRESIWVTFRFGF